MINTGAKVIGRLSGWTREVQTYWHYSQRARDFALVMRIRLSQSKVGSWVTPEPIVVDVNLRYLGSRVRLRSHATDISVLAELAIGHSLTGLIAAPDAHTVVDLGANTGLAYRWLRAQYPSAQFVCVEPDPGNLEILRANVLASKGPCEIIPACIGARARRVNLATTDGAWGFHMVDVENSDDGDTDVITMEELLSRSGIERISILKCDIEGAEAELFANCRSWINRVDSMVVECHAGAMSSDSLLQALADNGATFEVLELQQNPSLGFDIATLQRVDNG
jgi:FkbM family methyltransferase